MGTRCKQRADARTEAAGLLRKIAGPARASVQSKIARAAERLRWSHARTENIWHEEALRIDSWEMDALRRVANEPG